MNHCLMTPSTLLPRHSTSLNILRERQVSASASQKTWGSVSVWVNPIKASTVSVPSYPAVQALLRRTMRIYLPRSVREASRWMSSSPSAGASQTSRWVFRRASCSTTVSATGSPEDTGWSRLVNIPRLQIPETLDKLIKVDGVRRIEVVFIEKRLSGALCI